MERIPASEKTRKSIREMLNGINGSFETSDIVRQAVRLIVEEALDAEVQDALGRGYYESGAVSGKGYRNGYRSGKLKTAEGLVEYGIPQVRDREDAFESRIRKTLDGKSDELTRLAVEMYARGLSTRDIEETFRGEDGRTLLSRSAVSEITERLWEEYAAFASRDLSEYEIIYLFVDGIAERLHISQPREAVLAAWGFCANGQKLLLHVAPGTKEDTACCREFFRDMKNRGLRDPILVATDGAPGLLRAVEECFPRALRQRCLVHKLRNLQAKASEDEWKQLKAEILACYQAASPALSRILRDEFIRLHQKDNPTLVKCFEDDFEACIAYLRLPVSHRQAVRTTNLLERLFGEVRRRTKVIPHAFGEKAMLKLMYASLIRASERWRNIKVTEFERKQLEQIKKELDEQFAHRHEVTTADSTSLKVSSKVRT